MKFLFLLCALVAVCSAALSTPEKNDVLLVRSRRDLLENIRQLIQNLIGRLQNAGRDAMDAVSNFTISIRNEAQQIRAKIVNDIDRFRHRVTDAIENVYQRFANTSYALNSCVDSHRKEAAELLNNTVLHTMSCIDERIDEVGQLIEELRTIATEALDEATTAVDDMKKCAKENTNILNAGSCLGSVAMTVEVRSVTIFSQSALLIGRINLSIASLPASMEVCAGSRIIQTGIQTGKIIMDVGTCSANAIFNNITGRE